MTSARVEAVKQFQRQRWRSASRRRKKLWLV